MSKREHSIKFTQESLTQQHQKEAVDINNIMKRYIKTGVIDHVNKHEGYYTENRETDYHSALNMINSANEMFLELPSEIRKQFKNDPHEFLQFVEKPENHEKLIEMGLATAKKSQLIEENEKAPAQPIVKTAETTSEPAPASQQSAE